MNILLWQQINNAIKQGGDSELSIAYNVLSVLTGESPDVYRNMKYSDFLKVQDKVKIPDINIKSEDWVKEFECEGERFYVTQFATDWNTEQFISMSNLTKTQGGIIDGLHNILAVMCYKEKGEIISLTEFNRRADLFQNHLDVTIAYPIGFFFANLSAQLLEHIQSYSMWKRVKLRIKRFLISGLKVNGDGMQLLINFLQKKKGKTLNTSLK